MTRRLGGVLADGRHLEIDGDQVLVDGHPVAITAAPRAVLLTLLERRGHVVSRRDLLDSLPSGRRASEHAVDVTVARLRAALGHGVVQSVIKRGYRLATEPR
jgi:uroporphyrinogen-III synthase